MWNVSQAHSRPGSCIVSVEIRYRLLADDDGSWYVRWLCGARWLLVHGPATQAQAREWMDGMRAQVL